MVAFDIAKAIEVLGEATKNGFSYAEKVKEKQSETEVLKAYKRQLKGLNIAEMLILLSYKYLDTYTVDDQKEFKKLLKKFMRYN